MSSVTIDVSIELTEEELGDAFVVIDADRETVIYSILN